MIFLLSITKYFSLALVLISINSCSAKLKSDLHGNNKQSVKNNIPNNDNQPDDKFIQIGDYVVETFEDSKANLWFGTLEKGVAIFDGKSLKYFTTEDGLPSNRIVSIIEDRAGNLWFGTDAGISKYDGKNFTQFSEKEGLVSNMVSIIYIDSKGVFWVGTWGGVSQFDGTKFTDFTIPHPSIESTPNEGTKDWTTSIFEDSKGNIWFGRDGYGASNYNGKEFIHVTKKQGLYSNNVQAISEDYEGNIWIGTRVAEKDNPDPNKRTGKGGLNKYDGEKITHFPEIKGFNDNDVFEIYKDNTDNLWISTTSNGIYKYENKGFKNYKVNNSTMTMTEDVKGNLWLGCAGGLFRLNSNGVVNVTTNGPWE